MFDSLIKIDTIKGYNFSKNKYVEKLVTDHNLLCIDRILTFLYGKTTKTIENIEVEVVRVKYIPYIPTKFKKSSYANFIFDGSKSCKWLKINLNTNIMVTKTQFEQIYLQNRCKVLNFINFRVLNTQIAEEITNDCFVKVARLLPEFDSNKSSLNTWLFNIVKCGLIDYYRSKAHAKKQVTNFASDYVNSDGEQYFDFDDKNETCEVEQSETLAIIKRSIAILNETEQRLIILNIIEEQKLSEIAVLTGLTVANVKVILCRSKAKMRKYLEKTELCNA